MIGNAHATRATPVGRRNPEPGASLRAPRAHPGASWALFLWVPYALGHAPTVLAALAITAWLLVLSAGGEALRSKRDRAVQARRTREQESRRRAEERLRIAHELHDVLAHGIS